MINSIFENLFKPLDPEEMRVRKQTTKPFGYHTLWHKWAPGGYAAVYLPSQMRDKRLMVAVLYEDEDGNELGTDWPIMYRDGRIAYDYPEYLTPELRDAVEEAFDKKKELEQ